jgi:hypothetical protein
MGVQVDQAGCHIHSRGINHLYCKRGVYIFCDERNFAIHSSYGRLSSSGGLPILGRTGFAGGLTRGACRDGNIHHFINIIFGINYMASFDQYPIRLSGLCLDNTCYDRQY